MKINRWTAEMSPQPQIIENMLSLEGLDYKEIVVRSGFRLSNQRTPMTEIIQVIQGELIFNLSGNQFALRAGDRLEMSANTLYSYSNLKNEDCLFLSAHKI